MDTPAQSVDPVADDLIADMMRLGRRPYAEVGVPMFLVAEDLRGSAPPAINADTPWRDVAELFAERAEVLSAHNPDLDAGDAARLIEVFADRFLVGGAIPSFSAMHEAEPAEDRR